MGTIAGYPGGMPVMFLEVGRMFQVKPGRCER
jgi:hypothetical protein